jgi:hypothetical protein
MRTLALPFTPRFIVLTFCLGTTVLLLAVLYAQPRSFYELSIPIALFGGLSVLGLGDLFSDPPRGPAQLPDLGASAVHPGSDPARDAPVFLRGREGRQPVQP